MLPVDAILRPEPDPQPDPIDVEPGSRPLVAFVEGETLFVEGSDVGEHPYRRSLRSRIAYYPNGTDVRAIESYMDEQDSAYIGANRGAPSYTFRDSKGHHSFKVVPALMWGIESRQPDPVGRELETLFDAATAEDWAWGKAVTSIAGRVCREQATELRQLPARWRALSHAACHQGPTVVCTGGAPMGRAWDRKQAFLRALFEPVPVRESWVAAPPETPLERISKRQGLIRATVWIPPDVYSGRLPPLPVRTAGVTVYPAGLVRGAWTLAMLRDAVFGGGVRLEQVHELALCTCDPIHAWAGERIAAVKDRALRKLMYTRYWGRLASTGGWKGTILPPKDAPRGTVHMFDGSNLYWTWAGYKEDAHDCPPDYRPDHAAFIAGSNHLRMNQEIRKLGTGKLIGAHVDALWTEDMDFRPAPDFALKAEGETRFYGVGTYRCGPKLGAQGFDGRLTPETLEEHGRKVRNPGVFRSWIFGENPAETMGAISDPPTWERTQLQAFPLPGVATIYDAKWTPKGWARKQRETVNTEPNEDIDE